MIFFRLIGFMIDFGVMDLIWVICNKVLKIWSSWLVLVSVFFRVF